MVGVGRKSIKSVNERWRERNLTSTTSCKLKPNVGHAIREIEPGAAAASPWCFLRKSFAQSCLFTTCDLSFSTCYTRTMRWVTNINTSLSLAPTPTLKTLVYILKLPVNNLTYTTSSFIWSKPGKSASFTKSDKCYCTQNTKSFKQSWRVALTIKSPPPGFVYINIPRPNK